MTPAEIFPTVPAKLRNALLKELSEIEQNYLERRWSPSELSGGRFCEIVFCIIAGHASGKYEFEKPKNMVAACRKLEEDSSLPRSFQILIPRLLPAIYEVRNNRNVGHIGGDVDPSHMDATFVLNSCNWIMAELVRVLHGLTVSSAQSLTDNLAENRIPFIWHEGS